jgi:hypothetical protein
MSVSDSVSATCPKMGRQQELVSRILMSTNRVFQGTSTRSQTNPESFTSFNEQPRRGLRIEAAIEEKWKSDPRVHIKSSLTLRAPPQSHGQDQPQGNLNAVQEWEGIPDFDVKAPYQVKEVFTQPIVQSIGRRSSTIARVLPTGVPTLCDSPMRLRIL